MTNMKNIKTISNFLFIISGLLLGIILIVFLRFISYQQPIDTHFHANFAIFINNNKVDLSKDKYMEPVLSCSLNEQKDKTALERVHMHLNNGGLIHVHDTHVTWADFFSNINFYISTNTIVDDTNNVYKSNDTNKVSFLLNGKKIDNINTLYINSEDKLLINYGNQNNDDINKLLTQVPSDAKEANIGSDPYTCTGNTTKALNFWEKLKKSLIN